MMLPFGVLLPLLRPHIDTVRGVAGRAALTSLGIEVTQLLSGWLLNNRHSVDVNDVLANTCGAVLGLLCLRLVLRGRRPRASRNPSGRAGSQAPVG
jgi:glycopeptide antibiotics resistance protein